MNEEGEKRERKKLDIRRGIRTLGNLALSIPLPFAPDFVMNDIHDLDSEMLSKASPATRVVIFDIDGTLEDYHSPELSAKTVNLITDLRQAGLFIAINSNAPDTSRSAKVHELFDDVVGDDRYVITSHDAKQANYKFAGKPFPVMIDMLEDNLKQAGVPWKKPNFLMVGDQLLKDNLAGKAANVKTLVVNRYGNGDDERVLKYQRRGERYTFNALGFPAVKGTVGAYRPVELPREMTRVSTYRKKQWNAKFK